jgi:hypothetical protein
MRRCVLSAIAALVMALPAQAPAAKSHLLLFPGKGGADTVWISGNDAGQAVGQKLSGSINDFVYFDGKRPHDLTSRLGHGAFVWIDPAGEAAGTTSSGFPLYYNTRTKRKVVLPTPGRATGIGLGPLVAVTLSNGTAELWNPLSGGILALGQASTTGVNASGTVVGHAADGNLWYSVPNGAGGATQTELPVQGNFDRVNNQNVAVGYERTGGRLLPVRFKIPSGSSAHTATATGLTVYRLLRGYGDGVLTGINDTNTVAFGNLGHNDTLLPSTAALWPAPDRAKKAPLKGMVDGVYRHFSSEISFYGDTGWWGGAITVTKKDVAYLDEPGPLIKLVGLDLLLFIEKWQHAAWMTDVRGGLEGIRHSLNKGTRRAACRGIYKLHHALQDEHDYLNTYPGGHGADALLNTYDDLLDGLDDLGGELGCSPDFIDYLTHLVLTPSMSQSPYPGTQLSWKSPTS